MRIIGEIPHSSYKITVFKMNNRLSVKFELSLMEQTYKFRISNELQGFEDVKRLLDEDFMKDLELEFVKMSESKSSMLKRFYPKMRQEFEEII